MNRDLTRGPVMGSMLRFAIPMILGDLLQQCYNIADTLIVGQYLGKNALAAVGSSFTLMTFLTSILLGLCMGSGAVFSIRFGQRDEDGLREGAHAAFALIAVLTLGLNRGAAGAAEATVMAQYVSGLGIMAYTMANYPQLRLTGGRFRVKFARVREIAASSMTYYLVRRSRLLSWEDPETAQRI